MPTHIKNLVSNFINVENKNWQIFLLKNWPNIIGNLNDKVTLEKVYNDTLILGVYDSCWMQELFLLSDVIIKQINEKLDQPHIKKLRFRKIEFKENLSTSKVSKFHNIEKIELSEKYLNFLKIIEDKQLSTELQKYLIRCHQQRQMK